MNFKEKVQSMTGKEIVMAMVNGLQKEWVKVNMGSFGGVRDGGICYGCAATNAVCDIAGKPFNHLNILSTSEQAFSLNVSADFLYTFEDAIDDLRMGHLNGYNHRAKQAGFAVLPEPMMYLPHLNTDNYKEGLQAYIDYANSL